MAMAIIMSLNLFEVEEILEKHLLDKVDHYHLNHDVPELVGRVPTLEVVVVLFWQWLATTKLGPLLYELKLRETDHEWASYRGE